MTTCKVCGKKVRKTVLAMILRDGKLKSARVCQPCESQLGVTIVVAREVPHCKRCPNPATVCHVHADSGKAPELSSAIKTLKGQLKLAKATPVEVGGGDEAHHLDGRIEGLESAIALLEGGRF